MGDCFEKLGVLLNEKIQNEENKIPESVPEKKEEIKSESDISCQTHNISSELLLDALKNKTSLKAEVVHPGEYTEDVPVKIITGEAEFK